MLTTDLPTVVSFVCAAVEAPLPDPQLTAAIGWLRDDEVVAGVIYEHFTGASITATIANAPGAVLVPGFMRAIFKYPFQQLGVNVIIAFVSESNWKSRNLLEKMGFTQETKVIGAYPDGDMLIYTMSAAQCRWLEKENGQEQD